MEQVLVSDALKIHIFFETKKINYIELFF